MLTQKIAGICLSALVFAGICTGAAAPLSARADEEPLPEEPEQTVLSTENAELFLPETYEQYLPLVSPSYMAMSNSYIAVADGQALYLYNKTEHKYTTYDAPLKEESDRITKVQFSDDGRLFFSAGGLFYEYSFETNEAREHEAATCSTFLVVGSSLYTVRSSEGTVYLNHYYLSDISRDGETRLTDWNSYIVPRLSYQDGKLYIVRENSYVRIYDVSTPDKVQIIGNPADLDKTYNGAQIVGFQFACAYGDYLYYTVNGEAQSVNGLYRTDFTGNAELLFKGSGFSAINSYDGNLYCIRGSSVLGLSVGDGAVTYSGYEIAASSASVNRLSGATDTVRAGNLLVTADSANSRVSVYDFSTQSYTIIDCDFTPLLVATDGGTIAVASESSIYVSYPDEKGHFSAELTEVSVSTGISGTTVRGLTCIFGNVYYVLNSDLFGVVGGENIRSARLDESVTGITSDLYGSIYVSTTSGSVYAYSEADFLENDKAGVKLPYRFPEGHRSLRADFEGNLYCIVGDGLYKNGELFATVSRGFVYERSQSASLCSFALGFEDSSVYFLFGDFTVKTKGDALDIPTLDKIAVQGAAEACFSDHEPTDLLVDVPEYVIGIQTDLAGLKETLSEKGAYFPYETYFRTSKEERGVLLASTEKYALVLLETGEKPNRGYKAALFRSEALRPVAEYYEEAENTAYLSSAVSSYFVPALCTDLTNVRLSRGAHVTVHGFVHAPHRDYARISYQTEERAEAYGYIPASFLTEINPLSPPATSFTAGYVKKNADGILFTADDGETVTITERTRAKLYADGDGYLAHVEIDGKIYQAHVLKDDVDWGSSDALRISLIIILTVLALIIIGAYAYLLPRKSAGAPRKKSDGGQSKKS